MQKCSFLSFFSTSNPNTENSSKSTKVKLVGKTNYETIVEPDANHNGTDTQNLFQESDDSKNLQDNCTDNEDTAL